jgi:hypothetical protein
MEKALTSAAGFKDEVCFVLLPSWLGYLLRQHHENKKLKKVMFLHPIFPKFLHRNKEQNGLN